MGNQSCCAPKDQEEVKEANTIVTLYNSPEKPEHQNMRDATENSSLGEVLQESNSSFIASTRPTALQSTEVGTERCFEMLETKAASEMEALRVHYGGMSHDKLLERSSPSTKKNKLFIGELDTDFKRTGYGVLYCEGHLFEGNWEHNQLQGEGILIKDNHEVYIGKFVNKKIVKGRLNYPNGSTYEGKFDENLFKSGKGKEVSIDGSVYTGEFFDDLRQGQGQLTGKDKSVFKGEFWRGYKAKGSLKFADGSEYNGEFSKNKMQGTGNFKHTDGSVYVGEFIEGKMHGAGKFRHIDGSEYVGHFIADKMHGTGKFRHIDGSVYDGAFENDKRHGKGKLLTSNGEIVTGEWSFGKLVKEFSVKNAIGRRTLIGIK
jgi:hypothetical protein